MIQSGKFDSSDMDIKKLSNTALTFITNRLIEIFGICVLLMGFLILIALISYSPEDPNFIFPDNTIIKNVLGYHGSVTSDFIFQSIGLIGYFLPITYIFTGLSIFRKKEILVFIENTFFITIYALLGSLFFSKFYSENFTLYINGSGGFVGNYLSKNFLIKSLYLYLTKITVQISNIYSVSNLTDLKYSEFKYSKKKTSFKYDYGNTKLISVVKIIRLFKDIFDVRMNYKFRSVNKNINVVVKRNNSNINSCENSYKLLKNYYKEYSKKNEN